MSSGKTHKKYDESFIREAVRLVEEEGMSCAQVERDLGITTNLVSRWRKAIKEDNQMPFPGKGYQRPEQAGLSRRKRENSRLKRERDILKKPWPSSRKINRGTVSIDRSASDTMEC